MGYLHIENLYKNTTIKLFKECYALEKIHGTSAHISVSGQQVYLHHGGCNSETFHAAIAKIFNVPAEPKNILTDYLKEKFAHIANITIYGEAYGGKIQKMSHAYGVETRFVAFDVKIDNNWLNVPRAAQICENAGIQFVAYNLVSTSQEALDAERDLPSTQAIRNGCGSNHIREGVVLRPTVEMTLNNGERVITKHKRAEFMETSTPREVDPDKLKVIEDAKEIALEWVTKMRLIHVLDKIPEDQHKIENTGMIINAMKEDVLREAKDEIVESKTAIQAISTRTALLFKEYLRSK